MPPNNSPVTDVSSNNIICNVNGNVPASGVTDVPAGATVSVQWDSGAHPGPNLIYLAKVSDAKTSTITGLKWFKVSRTYSAFHVGLNADCMIDFARGFAFERCLVLTQVRREVYIQDPV